MTYLFAILAGVAGAAIGWFAAGLAALGIGGLLGMGDFEGGRAMFAFFGIGPIGGLIGLIAGVLGVLRYHGKISGFPQLAGRAAIAFAGIAALAGGGFLILLNSSPNLERPFPRVVFEIRLPADVKLPDNKAVKITLDTDKNQSDAVLQDNGIVMEGGRPVLRGHVDLYFRTTSRLLVLKIAGEPDRIFQLKLWGNPGPMQTFTTWEPVEFIAGEDGLRRADDDGDRYEFRYRVERDDGKKPLLGNASG